MADEIVANGKWVLRGTQNQKSILRPVFEPGSSSFIAFPWQRINALPHFPVPVSWADLNEGTFGTGGEIALAQEYSRVLQRKDEREPVHPHIYDERGNQGHAITRPGVWFGKSNQRLMVAGVFWTDGRIQIDERLENRPDDAREVLSAEIAHAVDYGLPLTDSQKAAIMLLLHPDGADSHTWWERQDYEAEYYTLVGESFMAGFTLAYSQMTPWQDPFTHMFTAEIAEEIPSILGVPPVGTEPPPESGITLTGRAWRTHYGNAYAELLWGGAYGGNVSVWRNSTKLMKTPNDGHFVNFLGARSGTFAYEVRDSDGRRSNLVPVTV